MADKEWYNYPDGRDFKCKNCGQQVGAKQPRYWSKKDKSTVCETCFKDMAESHGQPVDGMPKTRCMACGLDKPHSDIRFIRLGVHGKELAVCGACVRLTETVANLKRMGLWIYTGPPKEGEGKDGALGQGDAGSGKDAESCA